jgi:hypothetical protein
MCLISVFLASGYIFHTYEGNSACLPRCLLSHTIISAYKCFISDFHVCAAQYNTEAVHVCKSYPVHIPTALRPTRAMASQYLRCLYHAQRHITFGRDALDE